MTTSLFQNLFLMLGLDSSSMKVRQGAQDLIANVE